MRRKLEAVGVSSSLITFKKSHPLKSRRRQSMARVLLGTHPDNVRAVA
jgi:hypothetical protein